MFSEKQKLYLKNANHRWNIKTGATRSGKTYCDYFVIPKRIRACRGEGLIVLIGSTVSTLCRNILDPMRSIWGEYFVGKPGGNDTVMLFGKKCWLIGASRSDQAAKLQGSGIEYAYGDEITTWSENVFQMLKSRLDKDHSVFDGTCNPEGPEHWFKKFLDSDADIFHQNYVIDDNPFLSPSFILSLKKEYEGTVYYDRYIMGKWRVAEGIIYRRFADDPSGFIIPRDDERLKGLSKVTVGVDFGGNKSGSAFVACGTVGNYESITVLSSELHRDLIDSDMLGERFCDFIESVEALYGSVDAAYCDNAEPILIRSLKKAARSRGLTVSVRLAKKSSVNDRIRLVCRLMSQKRFFLTDQASSVKDALMSAVYDSAGISDTRLDNGTSDIDSLDALEYSIERDSMKLIG